MLQDAMAIFRETGDRQDESTAVNDLGIGLQGRVGLTRRSPRTGTRRPSSGRSATGAARAWR